MFGLGWRTEALGVSGSGAGAETAGRGEVAGVLVAVVLAEAAFACAGELGQRRNGAAVAVAGAR